MANVDSAKKEVSDLFNDLSPLVQEIVDKYSKDLDKHIFKIANAATLTNDEIRSLMLEISVECYMFGMSKDAALFKHECAETLLKEAQAKAYNTTDGTQVVRSNQALIDTIDKQVVNMLYSAVANLCKTKLDEGHRMVNTLNSILISRNAEAKLSGSAYTEENSDERRRLLVE